MNINWREGHPTAPRSPLNIQVTSAFETGVHNIRWDPPTNIKENSSYDVIGVNIYRSDDSEFGPYKRVNKYPISGTFFQDRTKNCLFEEVIRPECVSKDPPGGERWFIKTSHPIVKKDGQAIPANSPEDVEVYIDGEKAIVLRVFGQTGTIQLDTTDYFDASTESAVPATLPGDDSEIIVKYRRSENLVQSGLERKSFYRITTVALSQEGNNLYLETPLRWAEPHNKFEVETIDYIWKEGVRRNNWILEQGGERVKFFIKKTFGIPCYCTFDVKQVSFAKQPHNRCGLCLGVGILGGYTGPFEGIIAPDDAERKVAQSEYGRNKVHTYDTWTGPAPLLTQRDFIVKQTNERYSIGPVRRPNNRGNILQQHFNMNYLDEGDIRYQMPITGIEKLPWPQCRISGHQFYHPLFYRRQNVPFQVGPDGRLPITTEKDNIPDSRELRGRTAVWVNHMY